MSELSDKHKLFVAEYIKNNCNAFKAYKATYPDTTDNAARVSASELLTNPNIREAIDDLIDEILNNKKDLTLQVLNEYKKIAFSDMKDFIDPQTGENVVEDDTDTSVIHSIQFETIRRENQKEDREKFKFKLYNKQAALDSISKLILGLAEKHQFQNPDGSGLFDVYLKNLREE